MSPIRLCASGELIDGGEGLRFTVRREGVDLPAFVVRHKGEVRAYLNRCSHLPVTLDWEEGKFFDTSGLYLICATHGALFEPDTGLCVDGPCRGASLSAVPVEMQDGEIRLVHDNRSVGQDP